MQFFCRALDDAPWMNLLHFFACTLVLLLLPMLTESLPAERNKRSPVNQHLYKVHSAYEEKRLKNANNQVNIRELEEKVANLFYQRYHRGQPEIATGDRKENPKDILQKMCEPGFDEDSGSEDKNGQNSGEGLESTQAAEPKEEERAAPRAPAEMSELYFWGSSRKLYNAVGKINFVFSPPRNRISDAGDIARPTFSESHQNTSTAVPERDPDFVFSYMYRWMIDTTATDAEDCVSKRVTPMAMYFLHSERFLSFLDRWKPSSDDAGLSLTRDEVGMIRALVMNGRPFDSLTRYHKLVFSKLLLVRTGFDAFGMMKAARYELGLEFNERATVGNFLHALYAYFMAVYDSDGSMKVLTPIGSLVMKTPLFSSAYAQCDTGKLHMLKHHGPKKYSIELGLDLVDSAPAYLRGLIVAALAWQESSFTRIEQDAIRRLAGEMRDYNRSE
ncbi:hypothetical protein PAPHI01_2402 [Pancytospora philotis]|nr:hypothetical protein PAPHI01_2402 [Pancytospora philotis]